MATDEKDTGIGDPTRFPAENLERLYRSDLSSEPRIRGDALNQMLQTTKYHARSWYLVIDGRVKKL